VYAGVGCPVFQAGSALAVDNLEHLTPAAQTTLFHALQTLDQSGGQLLVASRLPVQALGLLPDVTSRLLTFPQLEITPPTDAELRQLVLKWAADEQLTLEPAVVEYVLTRAARSAPAVLGLLGQLNVLSLQQRRAITVPLVRQVLQGEGAAA
jgi:DnaA-homolog protein